MNGHPEAIGFVADLPDWAGATALVAVGLTPFAVMAWLLFLGTAHEHDPYPTRLDDLDRPKGDQ